MHLVHQTLVTVLESFYLKDKSETTLRKKKYKCDLDLTFYTDSLLMEFTNTIFCNLQLMSIKNFSFDRNSTTPLEHKFGNVRVRANDIHTIQNFLRIISMMQTVDQVRESDSKIRGRSNSFGVVVEDKESDDESWKETYFHYIPQTFARCVLAYSGFDVKSTGLVPNDDVLGKGINFLYEIVEDEPNKRRKKRISSNDVTLGINYTKAHSRIMNTTVPKKEQKREIINDFLISKFGEKYSKKDILKVLKAMYQIGGESVCIPPSNTKKDELLDYLCQNAAPFWGVLERIKF